MPPGRLPREVFQACPTGRRPRGRPRTRWRNYVSRLAWERLGVPPEELEEVSGVREVWASLLRLLPPRPGPGPSVGINGAISLQIGDIVLNVPRDPWLKWLPGLFNELYSALGTLPAKLQLAHLPQSLQPEPRPASFQPASQPQPQFASPKPAPQPASPSLSRSFSSYSLATSQPVSSLLPC
ncbi:hypothetical protein L3Q82_005015 [Scortum barcoo]|uniref:Uncharacterized protein n=1 Tax=Scortum barcoo TaxID=214431 RepID=A0ACB8VDW3_9TELE|nr:hypothetical protein L3Q82_005015 [Scortum barcoo]